MRPRQKLQFARQLRREMTDAEHRLWYHLRNRALMGCKFRRQHPIGPYIADFVCLEARLVVELDGAQHAEMPGDLPRTAFLEADGYCVLRFWNNEAMKQTEAALAVIHDALAARLALTPTPLPQAGEGL